MKIPTPQEIGLPEKFERWRPQQEEALSVILTSKKRVKALCSPTGSGKSPVNVAAAILSKEPTCIVTQNRGLQDQMVADFGCIGMVDIRGRNNYQCQMKDEWSCEEGYHARCPYKGTTNCPSSNAEFRATASGLVTTNYSKWTSAKLFGQGMSHFKHVIFDEGHSAPQALAQAMQTVLHFREIEQDLELTFPIVDDDMNVWKSWAQEAKAKADIELAEAYSRIQTPDPKAAWVRHYSHMKNLCRRLNTIRTAGVNNWVVDRTDEGYVFDPIRPGRYAESMLFLGMENILITSATIQPKTLSLLGLKPETYEFKEFDSDFNLADCPVYYVPTQRVDAKHPDNSMMWVRHDQWAARRQDRKGMVQTVSYARRDEILSFSRFADRMMINPKGEPPTGTVEDFKKSKEGTILVSPAVGTGFDFPGKELEWIFMCKIPFEPPSKIVKAREADDKEYRPYKAITAMEQTFGRGNRFTGDRCDGIIPDDHMAWFWFGRYNYSYLASKNFRKRLKWSDQVPGPLAKM